MEVSAYALVVLAVVAAIADRPSLALLAVVLATIVGLAAVIRDARRPKPGSRADARRRNRP